MATAKRKPVKQYITVQNTVLLIVTISVIVLVAMLFGGWSIRETKERIKPLENNQEVFKKQSEAEKKIINQINFKVDSLEKVIEAKNKERAKQVIIIQQQKNKEVEKINSPGFTDADIKRAFSNN